MQELQQGGVLPETNTAQKMQLLSGSWQGRCIFALLEAPRFQTSPREIAKELNITLDTLFLFLDLLESLNLIKKDQSGKYMKLKSTLDFRHLDLNKNMELENFKSVASEVLIRQSPDGNCRYESSIIYSNKELVAEFIRDKNEIIEKFIQRSREAANRDVLVGYQYAMADMIATGGVK
ncbi:MAG: DUF4423 domain-containing protein [Parachlamydiaceae bacterium]